MADVAALAGVSSQTVSRVSNSAPNVESSTRQRVLDAMSELGYRPNSAARALKTGRFRSIGVIMFTLSTLGNMRTLDAIVTAASGAGYTITLMPVAHPTEGEVAGAFSRLQEEAVDGVIIVIEAHMLDRAEVIIPVGLPVVIIDSDARDPYVVVDTDQEQGTRLATQHLLDLGHRCIVHVSGPDTSFSATRREAAWAATMRDAGVDPQPVLKGDWTTASGYRHGLELARRDDVTAVVAANDQMALGVMHALHESGRSIPRDVSVIGFDDTEESGSFWPPLTTVHQNFTEIGRRSMDVLLELLDGRAPSRDRIVPTHLVVRKSTAAPRR
ncbi:LacI family transcriptional regulator [Frigoribacterium faeni]|uniref:DNA-binding LacI/PurR family transcriptional regulator n=2 Tax=Frigoribacterium faeni TaxID=145483 RepID=A0A7W3JIY2_9MICO|nr:LacI family DNA-binding transcriptional regulator [Frigoribacterium faeni]MBA8813631.1 DNA-binding LacI/PurR family transcriptional regulator [Frigoribacterium faeni]GEK83945.1 LacI family transcriptional regulator [Frigoribacterium faeni]